MPPMGGADGVEGQVVAVSAGVGEGQDTGAGGNFGIGGGVAEDSGDGNSGAFLEELKHIAKAHRRDSSSRSC